MGSGMIGDKIRKGTRNTSVISSASYHRMLNRWWKKSRLCGQRRVCCW